MATLSGQGGEAANVARARQIFESLQIDKEAFKGQYVAIDLATKVHNISSHPIPAERELTAQGYAAETIIVLQI